MVQYLFINDLYYVNICDTVDMHQSSIGCVKNVWDNVGDNEISYVSYLFTQKEVKHDIYYLGNSKQAFTFTFSLTI